MVARKFRLPQWPFSYDYRFIGEMDKEAKACFGPAGVAIPEPKASPQIRADHYAALLAGPTAPGLEFKLQELRRYLEALVGEVGYQITGGQHASVVADITSDCVLTSVRCAGDWLAYWYALGAPADFAWTAFLIGVNGQAVRKMIRRRVRESRVFPFSRFTSPDGRSAEFSSIGYDRQEAVAKEIRRQRLLRVVATLPALQQRCLRLSAGLWPARKAWKEKKIARILVLDQSAVNQAIQAAKAKLAKAMHSSYFGS